MWIELQIRQYGVVHKNANLSFRTFYYFSKMKNISALEEYTHDSVFLFVFVLLSYRRLSSAHSVSIGSILLIALISAACSQIWSLYYANIVITEPIILEDDAPPSSPFSQAPTPPSIESFFEFGDLFELLKLAAAKLRWSFFRRPSLSSTLPL